MGMSLYLRNLTVNLLLGRVGSPYTAPATVYVALFTTMPGVDDTGGVEVTGFSYARVSVANNTTNWGTVTNGTKLNLTAITFPSPSGSWGNVVGFGIYDASSAGNLLCSGTFAAAFPVSTAGQTLRFAANRLTVVTA